MQFDEFVSSLKRYEIELQAIMDRFQKTHDGWRIFHEDHSKFEKMVIELRDLYDDAFGRNDYSTMTINAYNEGVTNFTNTPSHKSVERVKGIASSVLTRIERNPELLSRPATKSEQSHELQAPEKVTLSWLFHNVHYSHWLALIVLLFTVFCLGVTATTKLSIVQEWVGIKVESISPEATNQ